MNTSTKSSISRELHPGHDYCDINVVLPSWFKLESGESLSAPQINIRIHGSAEHPAVIASGGISSGRIVADTPGEKGWWANIAGAGRAIDPDDFCIIAFDFLPNDGERARRITTADQAHALAYALDILKIDQLHAFVGASYGGMVALKFAAEFPERVKKLCVISASDKAHPAATAIRGIQRRVIEFATNNGNAAGGVNLARQLAMITYRSAEEFETRFSPNVPNKETDLFPVCEYLTARGRAYAMEPTRYLTLSHSIDLHRVAPERIKAETLIVGATTDSLVPIADVNRTALAIPGGRCLEINSIFGHDAFLKETAAIGAAITSVINESEQ